MITRRARPRYRVAVEVTHAGGWRAWNAVAAAFEQRLAAQASPVVHEPRLESETRRGSDVVRVRIAMTVRAADPGQAAVIAWDVFKVAVGEDAAMWDLDAASAEIRPEGSRTWLRGFPALAILRCRGALGDPLVVVARGLGSAAARSGPAGSEVTW
jgi:hypothetical protein